MVLPYVHIAATVAALNAAASFSAPIIRRGELSLVMTGSSSRQGGSDYRYLPSSQSWLGSGPSSHSWANSEIMPAGSSHLPLHNDHSGPSSPHAQNPLYNHEIHASSSSLYPPHPLHGEHSGPSSPHAQNLPHNSHEIHASSSYMYPSFHDGHSGPSSPHSKSPLYNHEIHGSSFLYPPHPLGEHSGPSSPHAQNLFHNSHEIHASSSSLHPLRPLPDAHEYPPVPAPPGAPKLRFLDETNPSSSQGHPGQKVHLPPPPSNAAAPAKNSTMWQKLKAHKNGIGVGLGLAGITTAIAYGATSRRDIDELEDLLYGRAIEFNLGQLD